MKLENSFVVPAPVEQVWPALLDIPRVAECLPGAAMEPGAEDGLFRGRMKIKVGPVTTLYEGVARLQDVDEDTHTASISVTAKEARGQGTASATITNRLEPVNGSTRVLADTDLAITGRQAQFGRGLMQDVAGQMMGEFAKRFEQQLLDGDDGRLESPIQGARDEVPRTEASTPSEPEAFDVGSMLVASPKMRRVALGAGIGALPLAVLFARRRPRRGFSIEFHFRP